MQTSEYDLEATPHPNGEASTLSPAAHPVQVLPAAPGGAGPRMPRRLVWLDLPDDSYPGFRVQVWVNAPQRLFSELAGDQDQEHIRRILSQLVVEHNAWLDYDGMPLPPPSEPAFWDEISSELAIALIALLTNELGKLGTSLANVRRGR